MFEEFFGSDRFVAMMLAVPMVMLSILGILDLKLSLSGFTDTVIGILSFVIWALIGILGVSIIGTTVTSGSTPNLLAFAGLLASLGWLFIEQSYFEQYTGESKTSIGRLITTSIPERLTR